MSKFYQHFSCSNPDKPLSEDKIKEMSKSLNILSLEEEKTHIDSITEDNDYLYESENDWIPSSFIEKLPDIDENVVRDMEKHDRSQKDREFFEKNTLNVQPRTKLTEKDSRNGQKILRYLQEDDWEFASIDGTPLFYNEYNGTWYPLRTIIGQTKLLSALSSKEKEIINLESVNKLAEAILSNYSLSHRKLIEPEPNLINFEDGIYDINTETVLPHSSKYLFRYCLDASTHDIADTYRCGELFSHYLDSSFNGNQDKINTLGEIFGLALSTIRDQKQMFFLYGPASSGKSVALNIIKGLISEDFVTSLSYIQLGGKFELSELNGSWLNLSSEIPNIKGKAADVIKRITGNDDVHAECKGKTGYKTHINALLVFATNTLPHAADDHAFYSRFRVLEYGNTIPKSEWVKDIDRRILSEELGYVLRFAIEGLKRYLANGMEITCYDESEVCIENSRIAENSFLEFAHRYITVCEGNVVWNCDLYPAYKDYCAINNIKCERDVVCSQILKSEFNAEPCRYGNGRQRGYRGISLNYSYDVT